MLAGKAEGRSLLIGEDQEPERRQEVGLSYKLHPQLPHTAVTHFL